MSDSLPSSSAPPPPPPLAEATDAVPFFTLEGRTIEAKVVDNYDADTLRAVISLNGAPTKFAVRLVGIDTPEKRSRNDLERKAARVARPARWAKALRSSPSAHASSAGRPPSRCLPQAPRASPANRPEPARAQRHQCVDPQARGFFERFARAYAVLCGPSRR